MHSTSKYDYICIWQNQLKPKVLIYTVYSFFIVRMLHAQERNTTHTCVFRLQETVVL